MQSAAMREQGLPEHRLSHSNFRDAYWSVSQMVAHHTVNGCNLQPGDLLGSGTQSGPTPDEAGSLMELSLGGKQPLALPSGETRTFLEDGDTVMFRGHCQAAGAARIGFGEVRGTVLPARSCAWPKEGAPMLQLYTYFRSSASYRVRIALNLKGLPYELLCRCTCSQDGGAQHAPQLRSSSTPLSWCPRWWTTRPRPGPVAGHHGIPGRNPPRARACCPATHWAAPACAPGAKHCLRDSPAEQPARAAVPGARPEAGRGRQSRLVPPLDHAGLHRAGSPCWPTTPTPARFCHGDTPSLADCCLIPQVSNARRFDTPLDAFPTIRRIEAACLALEPFQRAAPEAQADAV